MRQAVLSVAFSLVLLACNRGAADPSSLFPENASGWTKTGETRSFAAGDLWRYLDGEADKYISAGVRRTATTDYRYRDQLEAVADIHQFASPAGAASIMESEPAAGSQPAPIGDAGRSFGQTLVFRRGPYLVRLVAYEDTPETRAALTSLAQAIAAKI